MMQERVHCRDEAANHQLPIASAFWIIPIVSMEEHSNSMQNLMQIGCCTLSVILNAMTTQYTCSFNSIYHPHWHICWRHHRSHMHIPVHSPWLPGYINVMQTVLIILTMVQHFPDRPCTHKWLTTNITFLDILPVFKMYIQTNMKINFFPFYANNSTFPHCFYLDFFSLNWCWTAVYSNT